MNELDEIRQRITALEEEPFEQKLEIRITNLEDKLEDAEPDVRNLDDRITELEKLALILRAKIEPETLTPEAIERAETIAKEREEPEPC